MNNDYLKPVCYFYIDDKGRIAYVGKANGTIVDRVKAHEKEKKFSDCNCKFDIRYQVFEKSSDMDIAEKVYIKSLKPYLNVNDNTNGFFPTVQFDYKDLPIYENANIDRNIDSKKKRKNSSKKRVTQAEKKKKRDDYIEYFKKVDNFMKCKFFTIAHCIPIYIDTCDAFSAVVNGLNVLGRFSDNGNGTLCYLDGQQDYGMWSEFILIPFLETCVKKGILKTYCVENNIIYLKREDFVGDEGYVAYRKFQYRIRCIATEYQEKDYWRELLDIFSEAKKNNDYHKLEKIFDDSKNYNELYDSDEFKRKYRKCQWGIMC